MRYALILCLLRISNSFLNLSRLNLQYLYEKRPNRILRASQRIFDGQLKIEAALDILEGRE